MWGYEYEEQKKKQRKKAVLSAIPTVVIVGLLAWGASVFFSISWDERQLFWAAESGEVGQIYSSLDAGADPNAQKPNGRTPLHAAAWYGSTGVARALLTAGADPNIRDEEAGETPLHTAVRANDPDMVIVLMSGGARTNIRTFEESEPDVRGNRHPPGQTPREMAEAAEFEEVVRILRGG